MRFHNSGLGIYNFWVEKFIINKSNLANLEKVSKMSGRMMKTATKALKYFTNPLVQGKYQVVPPPPVPDHIIRPPYINNNNPEFGKYEGRP